MTCTSHDILSLVYDMCEDIPAADLRPLLELAHALHDQQRDSTATRKKWLVVDLMDDTEVRLINTYRHAKNGAALRASIPDTACKADGTIDIDIARRRASSGIGLL